MKKAVFLNYAKVDYDNKLDCNKLNKAAEITLFEKSAPEEICKKAEGSHILITKELPMGKEINKNLPSTVELICEAGTGYNNIDIEAATKKNITVCNIPAYSSRAVAQLTFTFILSLSSSLTAQQNLLTEKRYDNFTKYMALNHSEVAGKTLGVIGAGKIAGEVIKTAVFFGMKVLVYSRTPKVFQEENVSFVSLTELLTNSDFVTIHCPLNEDTRYLIDQEKLALMKPSAYLINTSRGAIIKEKDLVEVLKNRVIAGAALDVLEQEPGTPDNPLFQLSNCILTPHIGWQCIETRQRLIDMLADNIQAFLEGKPINKVN